MDSNGKAVLTGQNLSNSCPNKWTVFEASRLPLSFVLNGITLANPALKKPASTGFYGFDFVE